MSPKSQDNRCQHIAPSGGRCKLPRSQSHDSFCTTHARAEEKLAAQFARTPEAADLVAQVLGSDHDFRTVTSVNAFISKLISARARKLITTRDAAVFAYMTQLLLISLPGVKAEFIPTHGYDAWDELLRLSLPNIGGDLQPETPDAVETPVTARRPRKKRRSKLPATRREFAEQVFAKLGIELPASDPRVPEPTQEESSEDGDSENSSEEETPDYADRTS